MSDILLTDAKNYMKRAPSSGTGTMNGPNVSRLSGLYFTRDFSTPHGLSIIPMFRAFYEPYRDDTIYEAFNDPGSWLPSPINDYPGNTAAAPALLVWADSVNINFQMYYETNALASTSFNIYWVIYLDYGMV